MRSALLGLALLAAVQAVEPAAIWPAVLAAGTGVGSDDSDDPSSEQKEEELTVVIARRAQKKVAWNRRPNINVFWRR